jgi:adenylate cyclase
MVIGAALVRIPTDRMWLALRDQLKVAASIALAVLAAGFVLSMLLAKYQVAPLERLTTAAAAIEERKFDPQLLDPVAARPDELGRLARVFKSMGEKVLAREEKLDTLVQERTRALAYRTEQLETLSTKLSKYLSPQVYASIFQGRQQVEIASNRKKLTVFFSQHRGLYGNDGKSRIRGAHRHSQPLSQRNGGHHPQIWRHPRQICWGRGHSFLW